MPNYKSTTVMFQDTVLNRWKKYLLKGGPMLMSLMLNHWLLHKPSERTENMNTLIVFCQQYLADRALDGLNGINPPSEFNLQCYNNVG